jgi:tetratricopeptide (TPR) repeat protein
VLIAAAAVAVYANSLSGPFVLDDIPSIADNLTIRHLGTALFPPVRTTEGGRPILNLSMAIDYAVSGTAVWSYHATNLAIHVLAALALFGIARRALARRAAQSAPLMAFCAALLWALHPLQTGSVTYVVQRAESLMGLFYLLTLYCFVRGAESGGPGARLWHGLSVAACLLGMGTKEVMVSAPLVVLLYDRTFLAGSFGAALRRSWPTYAGLAATWLILPLLVLSTHGRGGTAGFGSGVGWGAYALTQFPAILHYLRLCLWPHPLVFDYGSELARLSPLLMASAALVACLAAAAAWALVRGSALGFLGAAFFAILAPSSSVVPVVTETMAEHRMYLPLAPVVMMAVAGIYRWLGRGAFPICMLLAAALFAATWQRNEVYRSAESLWEDTAAKRPENDRAHNDLGNALKAEGRANEARAQFGEALRLNPSNVDAHINLGGSLSAEGRAAEAIAQYKEALALRPDDSAAHNELGNALNAQGRRAEARALFEEAVRLDPGNAEALNNLANCLNADGRTAEAVARYEEALRIKPEVANVHNNLGNALLAGGRTADATAQFGEALRLDPGYAAAHNGLGNALNAEGRAAEAAAQYREALRLAPDVAGYHLNLAVTLLRIPGGAGEAVAQLRDALRLEPDNAPARQILARIGAPEP